MKRFVAVVMLLMLHVAVGNSSAGERFLFGSYPFPVTETEMKLTRWMMREKFDVAVKTTESGEIVLHGTSPGKMVRMTVRPNSPLASVVELLEASGTADKAALRSSWEKYLATAGEKADRDIPGRVRALAETVVCITAPESSINFSGFLIGPDGTVLTIAHDIDTLKVFRLLFAGGSVADGRVVKSDAAGDLSVIKSDYRGYGSFMSLNTGRTKMKYGDRIFMLSCNKDQVVRIQPGVVDKPKATVAGQTLWQVSLEQVFLGSSGSPVVDENGRLVGVVKGRFRGKDTRGFLIPVDTVRRFVGKRHL